MRLVVLACLLAGCHPYVAAGVSPTWKTTGPLAATSNVSTTSRTAAQSGASDASVAPGTGNSYELELGSSWHTLSVGVNAQVHDVTGQSLKALAYNSQDPNTPRFVNATASLEVAWNWLHYSVITSYIHAGPARSYLYDREGESNWGFGYRMGAGLSAGLGPLSVYADLHKTGIMFDQGPADGYSSTMGLSVGVAINR